MSVAREGVGLSARTVAEAVDELVGRVNSQGEGAAPVLEWARGGAPDEITARHRLLPGELERRVQQLQVEGARTSLHPTVLAILSAIDATDLRHRRARQLFGLRAPRGYLPMRMSRSTDVALRVLAVLGPLPVDVLCRAVNRSRQPTATLPAMTAEELESGLRARGATLDPDASTWAVPDDVASVDRDEQLVAALRAAGPLTRVQLHQVLLDVGYTAKTPQSPIVDRNPLIQRTAPNRYELLT